MVVVSVSGDYDTVRKDFIDQSMLMTHPPAPDVASQYFQMLRLSDSFARIFHDGASEIETLQIEGTIVLTEPLEVLFSRRADLKTSQHQSKYDLAKRARFEEALKGIKIQRIAARRVDRDSVPTSTEGAPSSM